MFFVDRKEFSSVILSNFRQEKLFGWSFQQSATIESVLELIVVVNRFSIFREETRPPDLHPLPDPRAGERVPFQPLLDATAAHRDRPRTVSDRKTDQDLVPESPHEMEKGEQDQRRRRLGRRRRRYQPPGLTAVKRPFFKTMYLITHCSHCIFSDGRCAQELSDSP